MQIQYPAIILKNGVNVGISLRCKQGNINIKLHCLNKLKIRSIRVSSINAHIECTPYQVHSHSFPSKRFCQAQRCTAPISLDEISKHECNENHQLKKLHVNKFIRFISRIILTCHTQSSKVASASAFPPATTAILYAESNVNPENLTPLAESRMIN